MFWSFSVFDIMREHRKNPERTGICNLVFYCRPSPITLRPMWLPQPLVWLRYPHANIRHVQCSVKPLFGYGTLVLFQVPQPPKHLKYITSNTTTHKTQLCLWVKHHRCTQAMVVHCTIRTWYCWADNMSAEWVAAEATEVAKQWGLGSRRTL
jgi:hypothetical protein